MTNRSILLSVMTEYLEETTKYLEVLREKHSNNKDPNYEEKLTVNKTGETRRFSMQTNPPFEKKT